MPQTDFYEKLLEGSYKKKPHELKDKNAQERLQKLNNRLKTATG